MVSLLLSLVMASQRHIEFNSLYYEVYHPSPVLTTPTSLALAIARFKARRSLLKASRLRWYEEAFADARLYQQDLDDEIRTMEARRLHLLEAERAAARRREERERVRQRERARQQETRQWQTTQSWPPQWTSQPASQLSAVPQPSLVDQQPAPLQPCPHGVPIHSHSAAQAPLSMVQEAASAAAAASLSGQLPTGTSLVPGPGNCMVLTVPKLPVPSVQTGSPLVINIPDGSGAGEVLLKKIN